jgi:hypothetical protein
VKAGVYTTAAPDAANALITKLLLSFRFEHFDTAAPLCSPPLTLTFKASIDWPLKSSPSNASQAFRN